VLQWWDLVPQRESLDLRRNLLSSYCSVGSYGLFAPQISVQLRLEQRSAWAPGVESRNQTFRDS